MEKSQSRSRSRTSKSRSRTRSPAKSPVRSRSHSRSRSPVNSPLNSKEQDTNQEINSPKSNEQHQEPWCLKFSCYFFSSIIFSPKIMIVIFGIRPFKKIYIKISTTNQHKKIKRDSFYKIHKKFSSNNWQHH